MKRISLFLCLAVLVASMQIKAQSACDGLHNPMNFNHWYGKTGIRSTGVSTSTNIFNTSASSNVEIPWTQLASITTVGSCGSNCGQGSNPDNNLNRFQIITQQGSDANTGGVCNVYLRELLVLYDWGICVRKVIIVQKHCFMNIKLMLTMH